ncbi:hypothetical protein VB773_20140 [Haloarculaceae archaeon H-GB2-1]|nr:hypothetical protein [Haloarculaceae archaeon H-GB11]MEA5409660.1 hypothetical protein [Haloarculaceae archaeon H-GB2-1]
MTVDGEHVTVTNAHDATVTATAVNTTGATHSVTVPAGSSVTRTFAPGTYTLTGTTADGNQALVNGEDQSRFTIREPVSVIPLSVTVTGQNVSVTNPSNDSVTVISTAPSGETETVQVNAGTTVTEPLQPGTYTVTAESGSRRSVTINGQSNLQIQVTPPTLSREDLDRKIARLAPTNVEETETAGGTAIQITGTNGNATIEILEDGSILYREGDLVWQIPTEDFARGLAATDARTTDAQGTPTATPSLAELESKPDIQSVERSGDRVNVSVGSSYAQATQATPSSVESLPFLDLILSWNTFICFVNHLGENTVVESIIICILEQLF